jgi:alanyl-tRNA synthetase
MLTMEECAAIEEEVNRVIQLDLPVHEEYLDRVKAAAHFNLSRLPDEAGETIRIISIGDYDACPCSGPHIMHTLEIGRFRIISNSHENGVLRLRFKIDDE